jgi:hypothetical protein
MVLPRLTLSIRGAHLSREDAAGTSDTAESGDPPETLSGHACAIGLSRINIHRTVGRRTEDLHFRLGWSESRRADNLAFEGEIAKVLC